MRRTDREITDFSQMVEIMKRCGVCHISFSDEYPYVVPMNFGMKIDGFVADDKKLEALELLMNQYAKPSGERFKYEPEAVKHTCIIKLKVEDLSAKRLIINK